MTPNASSPSGFDSKWNINNISYVSPLVPTLVKILDGDGDDASDYNKTEDTFILPANKVIQVTFPPRCVLLLFDAGRGIQLILFQHGRRVAPYGCLIFIRSRANSFALKPSICTE
jgi:hypothetical protein